jgi:hypothetical protein
LTPIETAAYLAARIAEDARALESLARASMAVPPPGAVNPARADFAGQLLAAPMLYLKPSQRSAK